MRACSIFAATALCLIIAGCGIPQTTTYFAAPNLGYPPNFEIDHNPSNSESGFQGYEIYYRVYQDPSLATQDCTALFNAVNSLNSSSTPDVIIPQLTSGSFTGGRTYGLMSILGSPNQQPVLPILPTQYSSSIAFIIHYQVSQDWYFTNSNYSLGRVAALAGAQKASFYSATPGVNWTNTDIDYTGSTISGSTSLYLVAFVAGYGFDPSTLQVIYGYPAVFATYITFNGS